MSKKRKEEALYGVSPETLEKIRVKPEETEARLAKIVLHPRPEGKPPKGKNIWCCYCGEWAKLKSKNMGGWISDPRTDCCQISTRDFYMKTINDLWENIGTNRRK